MAYAEKRDGKLTGYWYGEHIASGTGQRFRRRFETRKGAIGYEAYVKATGEEPADVNDAKLAGPTFKETVVLMCAKKKGGRDPSGTRRRDLIVDRIGHLTLPAITTTVLDDLVEWLAKRPKLDSDSTINRYLSAVSGVFTWAQERDRDLRPPVIPWRKEVGKRIHWFSAAQEAHVTAYMATKGWLAEALALHVLCATGMRWGEFSGLEVHQCQPEWILLDETKTDTPRDVPIDEELARSLKAMVASGTVPDYFHMRTRLRAAVKACGYSPKLGIHNTRHGTATQLIKNGTALPVVQKFLGHRSIKTTMKYVHVEADDLMQAMKNLHPQRGETGKNSGNGEVVDFGKAQRTKDLAG